MSTSLQEKIREMIMEIQKRNLFSEVQLDQIFLKLMTFTLEELHVVEMQLKNIFSHFDMSIVDIEHKEQEQVEQMMSLVEEEIKKANSVIERYFESEDTAHADQILHTLT